MPREQSADFSFATMSTVSLNRTALAAQLGQLKHLPLGTVTENFLLVHANSAGPFSGFRGVVAANFHALAATAADAQLRGLLFDPECYRKDNSGMPVCWQPSLVCPSSCPSPCLPKPPAYSGAGCNDSCLVPCRVEALRAGEAVMDGILSAWPSAQVMSMFGPWLSTNLTHEHVPFMSDFAKENPIVGSFIVGWISSLHKHSRRLQLKHANTQLDDSRGTLETQVKEHDAPLFLDGAECYGFSNLSDVEEMKRWLKYGVPTTALVPKSLKAAFPSLDTVSPGVYDFPGVYHGRGPGTPAMWESDLVASLQGMDADGVTWAYSEKFDWFGLGNTGKPLVPRDWIDATRTAKNQGQLPPPPPT